MAASSRIEWTESTWNPVTGCTKVSEGCRHCYAERMALRLQAMGNERYRDGFAVRCHPEIIDQPLRWRKPSRVFVNSMSDLFHPDVPDAFICRLFETMERARQHEFQVLTKRPERLADMAHALPWPPNVWLGVTVESQQWVDRIEHLLQVPATVRFVSFEPLLTSITGAPIADLDWVIVGGESGPGARPMKGEWVRELRDQCIDTEVPFFFKQWGGVRKHLAGSELDGAHWNQWPVRVGGRRLDDQPRLQFTL